MHDFVSRWGKKAAVARVAWRKISPCIFSSQKNANVILVDCDPQRTTSDWVQERHLSPNVQWINCVQMYGKIRYELKSLEHHYDYVIVDCGGQDSVALRSAMSVASHVLFTTAAKTP